MDTVASLDLTAVLLRITHVQSTPELRDLNTKMATFDSGFEQLHILRPVSARQRKAIPMAFRWWTDNGPL